MKNIKKLKKQFSTALIMIFLSTILTFGFLIVPLKDKLEHKVYEYIGFSVESFMKLTSDTLANDYILKQFDSIAATANDLAEIKGVKYVAAYTNNNELIYKNKNNTQYKISYYKSDFNMQDPHDIIFSYENENVLAFKYDITAIGKKLGHIILYFSVDDFLALVYKIEILINLLIFVFICVVLFLVNMLLKHLVINPVKIITEAISDIKNGSLGKQVDLITFNEIGELAFAFNHLSVQNENMFKKLELNNMNLEHKIEQRTSQLNQHNKKLLKKQVEVNQRINEFEFLINTTMEAIIILEDDKCIDMNNECLHLFAFDSKEEVLNLDSLNFIEKDSHDIILKQREYEIKEPYEVNAITRDRIIFPILIKESEFYSESRNFKVIAIMDLTDVKKKEKILSLNSKMASMGEMLENIAHQWRQPLSTISVAASGLKIQKNFGILTDEMFEDSLDGIVLASQHMSTTIDDFKNFFKHDKREEIFELKATVNKTLKLINSKIKNQGIEFISNVEDLKILGLQNELIQVLMNIINNAVDAFENIAHERLLFITIYKKDSSIFILIKDNAGGVNDAIIDRIYEPYFTTKHQYNGTGIGLYMSKEIIVKHMKGDIFMQNVKFNYKNTEYSGAEFTIKFPDKS